MSKRTKEIDEALQEVLTTSNQLHEEIKTAIYKNHKNQNLAEILEDFDKEDIWETVIANKPPNVRVIEFDNIQAEAELDELLKDFNLKYILTDII